MKTTVAILITLVLAASGADSLLDAASSSELSTPEFQTTSELSHHEGAFRPISQATDRRHGG